MHVAVAGNIGSGKTTLTEKLAKHYGWRAEFESVDDNPYLADFYDDMHKWSFHLQIHFLNSRFKQIQQVRQGKDDIIQDRTIYEDAYIFAKNLADSGFLTPRDYENYLKIFHSMMDFVKPPDLLIYLKADIPKLVGQINKRGREYEDKIKIEYLKNLNDNYNNWIENYSNGKLLVIDVNNLDFVASQDDLGYIINKVEGNLYGLFSERNS